MIPDRVTPYVDARQCRSFAVVGKEREEIHGVGVTCGLACRSAGGREKRRRKKTKTRGARGSKNEKEGVGSHPYPYVLYCTFTISRARYGSSVVGF